jgi:hypothetical protein
MVYVRHWAASPHRAPDASPRQVQADLISLLFLWDYGRLTETLGESRVTTSPVDCSLCQVPRGGCVMHNGGHRYANTGAEIAVDDSGNLFIT